jgi:hypothetical protein
VLVCAEVNGLTPSCIGEKWVEFDVGFGTGEAKQLATNAGIRFAHWHTMDWHTMDFEA